MFGLSYLEPADDPIGRNARHSRRASQEATTKTATAPSDKPHSKPPLSLSGAKPVVRSIQSGEMSDAPRKTIATMAVSNSKVNRSLGAQAIANLSLY
jgi:hypothetical protein